MPEHKHYSESLCFIPVVQIKESVKFVKSWSTLQKKKKPTKPMLVATQISLYDSKEAYSRMLIY